MDDTESTAGDALARRLEQVVVEHEWGSGRTSTGAERDAIAPEADPDPGSDDRSGEHERG